MYIGMSHLAELCEGNNYVLQRCAYRYGLIGWMMLKETPVPYSLHIAYIADWDENLSGYDFPDGMHLILLAPEGADLERFHNPYADRLHVLLVALKDPTAFLSKIQIFFEYKLATGLFAESLLEIISFGGGIQEMVEHAFTILNNPIFVFDSSFNLIAATWEEAKKTDSAANIIANKGFTETEFQLANHNRTFERLQRSDQPFVIYQPELGFEQMLVSIDPDRDLGHIVVCAINRPFNSMDYNSVWILKRNIDQHLKKDEFVRNSKGFHYENFLRDLLDGKIATNKLFLHRMKYVGVEFSGIMRCIVVELARTPGALNPYRIRSLFESQFPDAKTILYNGQIIVLLTVPKDKPHTHVQIDAAHKICVQNRLYAGISNQFMDIIHLSDYYMQALRAIEIGISADNQPNVFLYEDSYLDHMKNIFLQKESADVFCHPKMKQLMDYDEKNHSQLAYTLYMYLYHERNIGATATAMCMHRSSLTYRFKKIFALVGDDFEDAKERQYLILSYELCRSV